ncbi:MAG: hypothetical protein GXP27_19205 [Planctomycetes bacterium]|nr:hypothetical protein [Planctomycetota bacterium]
MISRTQVSAAGLRHVPQSVGELFLGELKLPPGALDELPTLRGLWYLELSGSTVRDQDLRGLARQQSLKHLHVARTSVTGAGFRWLTELKDLRMVDLSGCPISEMGLSILSRLPNLETCVLR